MKKLYFTAVALFLSGMCNAQYELNGLLDPILWPVSYPGSNSFDTISVQIEQDADSVTTGSWINVQKLNMPKDAHGRASAFGFYNWDTATNQWAGYGETDYTYTYNSSDQVTAMVKIVSSDGYSVTRYATYTIDGSGNTTLGSYVDTIKFGATTAWQLGKDVMTYDGSGKMTLRVTSESSTNQTTLEDDTKFTYTWTGNNLTQILEQNWDGNSAWEDDTKQTLTYNGNNELTSVTEERWSGSAWQNRSKEEYTYDAQGRLATYTDYADTSGVWDNDDRNTITYVNASGSGLKMSYTISEKGNGTTWNLDRKTDFVYQGNTPWYGLHHDWNGSAYATTATGRILFVDSTVTTGSAPMPPSNLNSNTTGRASATVSLNWQDNSNDEDGFKVERGTDGVIFAEIADLTANTTSYSDTSGLTAGTQYFYRVLAYNQYGNSNPSNTADATTWTTGVKELSETNVSIYPNPASGLINLKADENGTYVFQNIRGITVAKGVFRTGINSLDISNFPAGVYIVSTSTASQQSVERIIVK